MDTETTGDKLLPVTHAEAKEIAQRLINSHFRQEPHARVSIPARPDHDDDLRLVQYIAEQERALTAAPVDHARAEAWEPISTMPLCDDEMWFCRGDVFEGPRPPNADEADYWDWWCYAKPPKLPRLTGKPEGDDKLTRQNAEKYLAWLDAGNIGKHFDLERPLPASEDGA